MPKGPFTLSTRSSKSFAATVANLYAANARVQAAVKREVKSSGFRLQRAMKDRAPVDTGFMKRHIGLTFTPQGYGYEVGLREAEFEAAGKPNYFLFQEFGTVNMAPRPFVFPARNAEAPVFKDKVVQAVRDALRKGKGRRG